MKKNLWIWLLSLISFNFTAAIPVLGLSYLKEIATEVQPVPSSSSTLFTTIEKGSCEALQNMDRRSAEDLELIAHYNYRLIEVLINDQEVKAQAFHKVFCLLQTSFGTPFLRGSEPYYQSIPLEKCYKACCAEDEPLSVLQIPFDHFLVFLRTTPYNQSKIVIEPFFSNFGYNLAELMTNYFNDQQAQQLHSFFALIQIISMAFLHPFTLAGGMIFLTFFQLPRYLLSLA